VATVEQPDESKVHVYPPAEALKSARPLPKREDVVIEDVSDEEWRRSWRHLLRHERRSSAGVVVDTMTPSSEMSHCLN